MRSLKAVALGALLLPLVSCASEKLGGDMRKLEDGIADLRRFQAEQTTRISTMETDLHALSGRVEELEYSQNKRIGTEVSSLKEDLSNLRRRVPPPAIVPSVALAQDESAAATMPPAVSQSFAQALAKVREGSFDTARAQLSELSAQTQGTTQYPLVLFWQGVASEGLNDNRGALASYLKLVSIAPKHQRAPAALLRQSTILAKLGDKKAAKLALNKLATDFPKTDEGIRAKEKLKTL